jgi:acetylornithine deacetylase
VRRAFAAVRARRPDVVADVSLLVAQGPSDVATDAPIVLALEDALRVRGEAVRVAGMAAWTDAALLNAAGIPAICFGPGDISLAHAAEEYIPLAEIDRATSVLATLARRWCA